MVSRGAAAPSRIVQQDNGDTKLVRTLQHHGCGDDDVIPVGVERSPGMRGLDLERVESSKLTTAGTRKPVSGVDDDAASTDNNARTISD